MTRLVKNTRKRWLETKKKKVLGVHLSYSICHEKNRWAQGQGFPLSIPGRVCRTASTYREEDGCHSKFGGVDRVRRLESGDSAHRGLYSRAYCRVEQCQQPQKRSTTEHRATSSKSIPNISRTRVRTYVHIILMGADFRHYAECSTVCVLIVAARLLVGPARS